MSDEDSAVLRELEAAELAWITELRHYRRTSNRRIRAVNDARDAGLSNSEIARAMQAVNDAQHSGRKVHRGSIPHLIACGYPEDDLEQEAG